jgi:L-ascorbate metabolism protein UlaG (beta-lactamase superfamily)
VIGQIEPRIVIPMHYASAQLSFEYDLAPLEKFTHERGLKELVPEEKIAITAANLPPEGEETRVVILRAVNV